MKVEFSLHLMKYNLERDHNLFREGVYLHRTIDMPSPPRVDELVRVPERWWAHVKQMSLAMQDSGEWEAEARCYDDIPTLEYQEGHMYLERIIQRLQSGWELGKQFAMPNFQKLVEETQKKAAQFKKEIEEVTARITQVEGLEKAMAEKVRWKVATPIEWIPVTERLPTKRSYKYLVASPGTVFMAAWEDSIWKDVATYGGGRDGQLIRYMLASITHWAELPAVPTSETERDEMCERSDSKDPFREKIEESSDE